MGVGVGWRLHLSDAGSNKSRMETDAIETNAIETNGNQCNGGNTMARTRIYDGLGSEQC